VAELARGPLVHALYLGGIGDVGLQPQLADRALPQVDADHPAPSSPKRRAVSAPMPLAAPVITHTFPSSLPAIRAANGDLPRNRLAIEAAVLALLD
jgi:hypothetical protein